MKARSFICRSVGFAAALLPVLGSDLQTPIELGLPPSTPSPARAATLRGSRAALHSAGAGLEVDVASREAVRNFYNAIYRASTSAEPGWTGNRATCDAGITSAAFRDLVRLRLNFYRAMAGVPAGIQFDDTYNRKCQQTALMLSVNRALSHNPPATWQCYTAEGAEAAGMANLALGFFGPTAIDGLVEDPGTGNDAVGHRRWFLYPQTRIMGTGDLPGTATDMPASAVWVVDGNLFGPRPAVRDAFVSWPPPGFVPYPVVFPRWSFSYPDADFTNATVQVTSGGAPVPVTVETVHGGYGENTLVWYPSHLSPGNLYDWPRPAADTAYTVAIRGAKLGGVAREWTYTVTVFDPETTGPDTVWPTITGSPEPTVNLGNTYTITPVSHASGYQWRRSRLGALPALEGAEDGLAGFAATTTPGYDVVVTSPRASGSHAFRLAHPEPVSDQVLAYTRQMYVGAAARLDFQSRLSYATESEVARVQVSLDQGASWTDVYSQPGNGGANEIAWQPRTASLSAYAGRAIHLRFVYDFTSGAFFKPDNFAVGWFIDDLTFTDLEEMRDLAVTDLPGQNRFTFTPTQTGAHTLDARAMLYDRYPLAWGPIARVTATTTPPPSLVITGRPTLAAGQVQLEFQVANFRPNLTFRLWRAAEANGAWTEDKSATLTTVTAGSRYRFTTASNGAARSYYRVAAY